MFLPINLYPYAEIVDQTNKIKQIRQELIEELAAIEKEYEGK